MAGLRDEPRPGKPAKYGVALRERLLAQLELPPAGLAVWDGGSMARELGVSDDAAWRALRKEGIRLQRRRSWCLKHRSRVYGQGGCDRGVLEPATEGLGAPCR